MKTTARNQARGNYALRARGAGENAPKAEVKRLYCIECGALRDARRVGRAAEYTLEPCGHTRLPMTSEVVQERNNNATSQ
jgi:hypothetical protein